MNTPIETLRIICVSVVRDYEMYRRCLQDNPCANIYTLHAIDNQFENANISVRYNHFLDNYNYDDPAWFIFCHEDFEIQEALAPYFCQADKSCLYGPIGVLTKVYCGCLYQWKLLGHIAESRRDGGAPQHVGIPVAMGMPVETFDCQCLIVHSDLIRTTGLRFDPRLSFDLYVEDFCIQAKEIHKIPSLIMPFKCKHWSSSTAVERYYPQEAYLKAKYPHCCYTGTSSYDIGTPTRWRRYNSSAKRALQRLLQKARGLIKSLRHDA